MTIAIIGNIQDHSETFRYLGDNGKLTYMKHTETYTATTLKMKMCEKKQVSGLIIGVVVVWWLW